MSRIGRAELAKEGFPRHVTHTAKGANKANLANSKTGAGSSAKSWQRYSHSEKEKRQRKGRRKKEGEGEEIGEGNREWLEELWRGEAAGKLCDGHRRGG